MGKGKRGYLRGRGNILWSSKGTLLKRREEIKVMET